MRRWFPSPAVAFAPCVFWLLVASAVGCGDLSPTYPEGPKASESAGAGAGPSGGGVSFAPMPSAGATGAAGTPNTVEPPGNDSAGSFAMAGHGGAAGSSAMPQAGGGGSGRPSPAPPSGPGAVGRH